MPKFVGNAAAKVAAHGAPKAPGFMKSGANARAAVAEEEARAAAAREAASRTRRFYIAKGDIGKDFEITFLDGFLDKEKMLDLLMWHEHACMVGPRLEQFVCVAEDEPCPICISGGEKGTGDRPSLVAGFTIIDHTPWTVQNGDRKGEVIVDQRKLFIPKRGTVPALQKIAVTYGGLRGVRLGVSRLKPQSPQVGDSFLPIAQYEEDELVATFGDQASPVNWEEEIIRRSGEQLVELGLGRAIQPTQVPGNSAEYTKGL